MPVDDRAGRPGFQVAGGMAIGCGGLLLAGAIVLVAAAFAVKAECPPPAVCGEGGPLSVLLAMPVVLLGTAIALAGLFMHRAGRQR